MKTSHLIAAASVATFALGALISYTTAHCTPLNETGARALDLLRLIGPVFMGCAMLSPFVAALESISRPEVR